MARQTATPTLEQVHAELPNAARVGEDLAHVIRTHEVAGSYESCRIAHAAVKDSGMKAQDVADATSKALQHLTGDKSVSVSRPAISQRVNAWQDVLDAGITPEPTVVAEAYTLATKGGSTPYREALVKRVKRLATDKRADAFIRGAIKAREELNAARKAKTAENAASKSADDKSETQEASEGIQVLQDTAAEVAATLQAWATREWTPAEKQEIREAMKVLARAIG